MRNVGNPFEDADYSWRLLDNVWHQTKQSWRDKARLRFERHQWQPLEDFMEQRYLSRLDELVDTIDAAEKATRHLR